MKKSYDVVVVGSGFGGGTVAMRLARAGKQVCVLERGRQWRDGKSSATANAPSATPLPSLGTRPFFWGRQFWNPTRQRLGLYELRQMLNLQGLVGAGVGGGSLIWANVVIEAPDFVFHKGWPKGITRESLQPYYRLANPFLHADYVPGVPGIPHPQGLTIKRTEALKQAAERLGENWSAVKVSAAVTYIAAAQAAGAKVHPLHLVTGVEPLRTGYRVHFRRYDLDGRVEAVDFVDARQVVLSAGTFGTTELLLRARAAGLLPHLSDALGKRFSTNGNVLSGALNLRPGAAATAAEDGPPIGSMINFGDHVVEDYANPTWTAGIIGGSNLQRIVSFALALAGHQPSDAELKRKARDLLLYVGVGADEAKGRLHLNCLGSLSLDWPGGINNDPVVRALHQSMARIAGSIERRYQPNVFSIFNRPLTYHPLGGCAMADDSSDGVVNARGEVFGYPNLYIADGSIVPTSLGRNPSYTIAALAERVAEGMLAKGAV